MNTKNNKSKKPSSLNTWKKRMPKWIVKKRGVASNFKSLEEFDNFELIEVEKTKQTQIKSNLQ